MDNAGCFQNCTNCSSEMVYCCYFDKINAPVLNKEELEKIKQFVKSESFYNIVGDNLYSLKLNGDNCIFYINDKCIIYDKRPVDCKLYPFDIIKKDEKYYLILYLLNCIDYNLFDNENIDSLINDVKSWIDEFTDERNFTKMKKKEYKIIKQINL